MMAIRQEQYFSIEHDFNNARCRSCLLYRADVQSICGASSNMVREFWECTGVEVKMGEGLPTGLCRVCRFDLTKAYAFRSRCRQSDALLLPAQAEPIIPDTQSALFPNVSSAFEDIFQTNEPIVNSDRNETLNLVVENESDIDRVNIDQPGAINLKFECHICRRFFAMEWSLKRHMRLAHDDAREMKQFKCPECPFSSYQKQKIDCHVRSHTDERPFQCGSCYKRFKSYEILRNHKKFHSDILPFTCEICGMQFKHRSTFLDHKQTHNNRKYECAICNKSMSYKRTLNYHMKKYHSPKWFACEVCNGRFSSEEELAKHNTVHDVPKFECDQCSSSFILKQTLEQHVLSHMGEQNQYNRIRCDVSYFATGSLSPYNEICAEEIGAIIPFVG